PFGIPSCTVDGMDVVAVREAVSRATARARAGDGPSFVECISYRFHQHSTSSKESRPEEEIEAWRSRCPIAAFAARSGLDARALRAEVDAVVGEAARLATEAAFPQPEEALTDVS
ncbi:MAG: thiamine pyrophosphate-dependent enzyme, partial [Polyangiaceae bacterium]